MKKLGLIGGTGPESTLVYYKELTSLVRQGSGRDFFPRLTVESLSVFEVLGFCRRHDYDGLTDYLLDGITSLAAAGCDAVSLTGITPHIVFDGLSARSPVPLVSMIDMTVREALRRGCSRVALLGTLPTMDGTFFRAPFERSGVAVVTPDGAEKEFIADKIETELEGGIVSGQTRDGLDVIIGRLASECGAEAVVLGCTELPLLYAHAAPPLAAIDPMRVHIASLADMLLGKCQ